MTQNRVISKELEDFLKALVASHADDYKKSNALFLGEIDSAQFSRDASGRLLIHMSSNDSTEFSQNIIDRYINKNTKKAKIKIEIKEANVTAHEPATVRPADPLYQSWLERLQQLTLYIETQVFPEAEMYSNKQLDYLLKILNSVSKLTEIRNRDDFEKVNRAYLGAQNFLKSSYVADRYYYLQILQGKVTPSMLQVPEEIDSDNLEAYKKFAIVGIDKARNLSEIVLEMDQFIEKAVVYQVQKDAKGLNEERQQNTKKLREWQIRLTSPNPEKILALFNALKPKNIISSIFTPFKPTIEQDFLELVEHASARYEQLAKMQAASQKIKSDKKTR